MLADGEERIISILGTGQGLAVVEGIAEGQQVRLNTLSNRNGEDSSTEPPASDPGASDNGGE